MIKHYTKKEIVALTFIHILFMLLYMPFAINNFIKDSNLYYILYFYLPILGFILPILIMTLQQKFHQKFGYLIPIVFLIDSIIFISLIVNIYLDITFRLKNNLNIFGNIIPFYLLFLILVLLLTHSEIFKRSFRKFSKVKVIFLNSPI